MTEAPTVLALHLSPARRTPMQEVEQVVAETGAGLVGDRYHGTRHRHRHVSVQSAEDLALAAADLGHPVTGLGTRRNVTMSSGHVPSTPGERLWIGDVELEVVRVAAPCRLLEETVGPGARTALRRRAGSVFRVIRGGTISLGDPVVLGGG